MNRSLISLRFSTLIVRKSSAVAKPPAIEVSSENARFDDVTHTGQAWDQEDYRLQRFGTSAKQVNPNIAMDLIAQNPPKDCGHKSVIFCDGGHPALGHPKVYINLDKPGLHACGYCGNRFYNSHITKGDDLKIEHLNC